MDELTLERALCVAVSLDPSGKAPDWVELLPAGERIQGRDGRQWLNPDPEGVVREFNRLAVDLAVDMEHAQDLKAPKGEEAPARGWVKELRHEGGGRILGRVEWTEKGRNSIESKEYRYLSPVLIYSRASRAITRIEGVGLVNRPNLHTAALNRKTSTTDDLMNEEQLKALCAALGVDVSTAADELIAKAQALHSDHAKALNAAQLPDLEKFVPRADYDALSSRVAQAEHRIKESEESALNREIATEIDAAVKAGKITPATKDFYSAMCRQADGLARFRDFVKAAPVIGEVQSDFAGQPDKDGDASALNARNPLFAEAFGNSVEDLKKFG